mmetsp:Transcript_41942/g.133866  ORF Transcript_41942/g.133866 Transcript_41942/m.133866 type:complete len:235 (+) Transcript_41942:1638-2342(+)
MRLPPTVFSLFLNPCLFLRLRLLGWNVRLTHSMGPVASPSCPGASILPSSTIPSLALRSQPSMSSSGALSTGTEGTTCPNTIGGSSGATGDSNPPVSHAPGAGDIPGGSGAESARSRWGESRAAAAADVPAPEAGMACGSAPPAACTPLGRCDGPAALERPQGTPAAREGRNAAVNAALQLASARPARPAAPDIVFLSCNWACPGELRRRFARLPSTPCANFMLSREPQGFWRS